MKMKLMARNGTLEIDVFKKSEGLVFVRLHPEQTPYVVDMTESVGARLRSLLTSAGLRTDAATYSYIDTEGVVRSGPIEALDASRRDWS